MGTDQVAFEQPTGTDEDSASERVEEHSTASSTFGAGTLLSGAYWWLENRNDKQVVKAAICSVRSSVQCVQVFLQDKGSRRKGNQSSVYSD